VKNCSISTSWRSGRIDDAKELIDAVKDVGFDSVELEFRLKPETFDDIRKNMKSWGLSVSSLHAVCPSPTGRKRGAELFLLSDEDEERRKKGVADIIDTIRRGADIGAKAIVVHAGRVPMQEPIYERMKLYDEGKIESAEADAALHRMLLDRMSNVKRVFPQLLKSLEEINEEAVRYGIDIGLENRYYFGEMPNLEEFGIIFNRFDGGRLKYWHDVGHAHVQEVLLGVSQKVLLETLSDRLIGIHLHDVKSGYTDHNEPGSGSVDFEMIKSFLRPDTIRVVELNARVEPENVRRSIEFLRQTGIIE